MGRPLRKDVLGTDVIRNGVGANTGIRVSGYFGGTLNTDYSIVKQRGATTFVVARMMGVALAVTGTTVSGSTTISSLSFDSGDTSTAANQVSVGASIHGVGIPDGAYIVSIDSTTSITISAAATASGTGVALFHDGIRQVGKLVNDTPNANGEIQMLGYVGGNGVANQVSIAKLTRRIAYGYPSVPVLSTVTGNEKYWRGEDSNASTNHDQTKYTWYLENDSSADIIVLTPITAQL